MKRQIISWGMMLVAAFTLTNCAKEIENPNQEPESVGYPFEIVASAVDTKTTNADFATEWKAGDQINLFHAVTGANDDYINNNAFTIAAEDLADGRFTGELAAALVSGTSYDWYAFYPYKTYITTPAVQTSGWTYIGGRSDTPQEQTGVNSMAHIAGDNYPLCGRILNVAYDVKPELTMSHASALLEVKVTNTLETELTVTSISFTALDNTSLVGQFYPCITGDEVTYTDGEYVSNVANLSVTGATVAAGKSASFYLAVKPFTAANGTELKITVNDADESTIKMTKDVKFSAGKIKTLNFAYDKVEEPAPEGTNEVTIDLTAQGYENQEVVTAVTSTPIRVSFDKGDAGNPPAYYTSGTSVRVYAKGSFTVESALGNITSIELTFGTSDKTNTITANVGTFSTNKWTGSSQSVTFTIGGTSGHRRIKTIKVTYLSDGGVIETQQLAAPVVTCTDIKSNSLTFEWAPVTNATKYAVIFNGGEEEFVENTSYIKSGLSSETEYSISVKAIGDGIYYMDSESVDCLATTSAADQPGGDDTNPVKIDITFSEYTAGTQYAENEVHVINDDLSLVVDNGHFTTQLRLYDSDTNNSTAWSSELPGYITNMTFNAGYKKATLNVYGSTNGSDWTLVKGVATTTAYADYDVDFPADTYKYFKLDAEGAQIRIDTMSVTYQPAN